MRLLADRVKTTDARLERGDAVRRSAVAYLAASKLSTVAAFE